MFNLLRSEIIKHSRLKVVVLIGLSPAILTSMVIGAFLFMKIVGVDFGPIPTGSGLDPTSPGTGAGTFGLANTIVVVSMGGLYLIGLVILGGMVGSNEYGWHTLKMLATREPSRVRIILSKGLFMATLAAFMAVVLLIGWLLLGLFLKFIFTGVGDTTATDLAAIGKGLIYLVVAFLINLLWSFFTLFLGVRFKSVVIAIIFYFVVNTLDGIVSALGAAALSGQLGTRFPNWLEPLIAITKLVSPFLVNFSFSQLTAQPGNPNFIESVSPIQSVLVLVGWAGLFLWMAALVFNNRDITE
jgi:ABC-type transport system involved in multi-copper enzyme maturation permease subunit